MQDLGVGLTLDIAKAPVLLGLNCALYGLFDMNELTNEPLDVKQSFLWKQKCNNVLRVKQIGCT